MAETPRSSHKLLICLALLCCAGAGSWFYTQQTGQTPWAALLGQDSAVPGETVSSNEVVTPHQVSSALNSDSRPRDLTPEEALNIRLDKALAGGGTTLEGGQSFGGALSEASSSADTRQDSVVSRHFVKDLAFWMVASYEPSSSASRSGRTSVTLRKANARYSTSSTLRSTEGDAFKARAAILRHVYSPGMLEALYLLYSHRFMQELENAAAQSRRPLDIRQTADMFKVYAGMLNRMASALEGASSRDVAAFVRPVHRAAATEKEASADFAKAYTAHSAARDEGRVDIMAEQSERMVQSARLASEFDAKKERARRALGKALRQKIQGPSLSEDDLIFLAEWLVRHKASDEATAVASRVCRRMAEDMEARAAILMQDFGGAAR